MYIIHYIIYLLKVFIFYPISTVENTIIIATPRRPESSGPTNLLDLNDDVLLLILKNSTLIDVIVFRAVCLRFYQLAELHMQKTYKQIHLNSHNLLTKFCAGRHALVRQKQIKILHAIISQIGQYVFDLEMDFNFPGNITKISEWVREHCVNLNRFTVTSKISSENIVMPNLNKVETLTFKDLPEQYTDTVLTTFLKECCTSLESLTLNKVMAIIGSFLHHLTNLKTLVLIENLNIDFEEICRCLAKNPNLKTFQYSYWYYSDLIYYPLFKLAKHFRGIEEISIEPYRLLGADILPLSTLPKLKYLKLDLVFEESTEPDEEEYHMIINRWLQSVADTNRLEELIVGLPAGCELTSLTKNAFRKCTSLWRIAFDRWSVFSAQYFQLAGLLKNLRQFECAYSAHFDHNKMPDSKPLLELILSLTHLETIIIDSCPSTLWNTIQDFVDTHTEWRAFNLQVIFSIFIYLNIMFDFYSIFSMISIRTFETKLQWKEGVVRMCQRGIDELM